MGERRVYTQEEDRKGRWVGRGGGGGRESVNKYTIKSSGSK